MPRKPPSEIAWKPTPGTEACNGIDDDCDGVTDNGFTLGAPCTSGVGACARNGTTVCNPSGTGTVCNATPGTPGAEFCNGIDDDCDGSTDEDFAIGPACTVGTGACARSGTTVCNSGGTGTVCNASPGTPSPEACNTIDDDCDGSVDEGCGCTTPSVQSCGSNQGECRSGAQACVAGQWAGCAGAVGPNPEVCNSLDDDCDGTVDEGCPCTTGQTRACGKNLGVCQSGTQTCAAGRWNECAGASGPTGELCDGLDNDCDGQVDELFAVRVPCSAGVGACGVAGTAKCTPDGKGVVCDAVPLAPFAEVCNGIDDDCDGTIDEGCTCSPGLTRACGLDVGECQTGVQTCGGNGTWGACTGGTGPRLESCDGFDNDCDGVVDEGCGCISSETRPCGLAVGTCTRGTQTCASGDWGPCQGAVPPVAEKCDGLDNDCDGKADATGGLPLVQHCYSGPAGTEGVGACHTGTQTCAGARWESCVRELAPVAEECNGLDDDCNGLTDDGQAPTLCPPADPCHLAGICDAAARACLNPTAPDGTACPTGVCTAGVCGPPAEAPRGCGCGTARTTPAALALLVLALVPRRRKAGGCSAS